jgi:hypothetical protein
VFCSLVTIYNNHNSNSPALFFSSISSARLHWMMLFDSKNKNASLLSYLVWLYTCSERFYLN